MKTSITILFIAAAALFYRCQELGPLIILEEDGVLLMDTLYISDIPVVPQMRVVLLEEFSGVRCPNCPEGNLKSEELEDDYPGRILVIAAHSDFLADPIGDDIDLRSNAADNLSNLIGGISSKPSASINRKQFDGESNIAIRNVSTWEQYVLDEMAVNTPVNIDLELLSMDMAGRTIRFRTTLSFAEAVSGQSIGIHLTESNLTADQRDGINTVEDYQHYYVLRESPLTVAGSPLLVDFVKDNIQLRDYQIDLNDYEGSGDWNMNNMELTVFIKRNNGEIVNAARIEF